MQYSKVQGERHNTNLDRQTDEMQTKLINKPNTKSTQRHTQTNEDTHTEKWHPHMEAIRPCCPPTRTMNDQKTPSKKHSWTSSRISWISDTTSYHWACVESLLLTKIVSQEPILRNNNLIFYSPIQSYPGVCKWIRSVIARQL